MLLAGYLLAGRPLGAGQAVGAVRPLGAGRGGRRHLRTKMRRLCPLQSPLERSHSGALAPPGKK